MNTHMLTRARRLFNSPDVPLETNRRNQLKWVRAVRYLGDKWLYAKHVERLPQPR